jgi:hypothetical protein
VSATPDGNHTHGTKEASVGNLQTSTSVPVTPFERSGVAAPDDVDVGPLHREENDDGGDGDGGGEGGRCDTEISVGTEATKQA